MKILMVCLGNICRSPTAEGVLRARAEAAGLRLEIDSAGTAGYHVGEPPDPRTVAHARRRGVDLSALRARQVKAMDFVWFDRIYAMDRNNLKHLRAIAPSEHAHKLALFLDVLGPADADAPALRTREVPDPWAGGPEDFEHVLDLCERASDALVRALKG